MVNYIYIGISSIVWTTCKSFKCIIGRIVTIMYSISIHMFWDIHKIYTRFVIYIYMEYNGIYIYIYILCGIYVCIYDINIYIYIIHIYVYNIYIYNIHNYIYIYGIYIYMHGNIETNIVNTWDIWFRLRSNQWYGIFGLDLDYEPSRNGGNKHKYVDSTIPYYPYGSGVWFSE